MATAAKPRRTQAERSAATRLALLDAAVDTIIEEGYANLSTRRVAERAGVAQSTQMHHFPTREAFLVDALRHVARRLAEDALTELDLQKLREPERRSAILDQAWAAFSSPLAEAATQMWVAAYTEPELAEALRELERDIASIVFATGLALFPEEAEDPRFPVIVDATLALIRGLALSAPISGRRAVERRWEAIKPLLVELAAQLLDEPA
jgi:AcrR family transcriptional regulator